MKFRPLIACVALLLPLNIALAQSSDSDAREFFQRLQANGASFENPQISDQKFWDELRTWGASNEKPVTSQQFVDRLAAQGVQIPKDFDREKFLDDLRAHGVKMPVTVKDK